MSTNRSVGRITATQEKGRSTATHNTARSTATQEHGRPAFKPKKDRSPNLCAFTFADGRQCRTPRCFGHLHLCYFHAQKEAESLAVQQVGQDISRFLPTKLLTACDLGVAMSRLFCAVAQGQVKPKVASTLAYLAQTMLQSIPIAQHEYCEALGTDYWEGAIRSSFKVPAPEPEPEPEPKPQPVKSMPAPTPKPTPQPPQSIPQPAQPASPPASSASATTAKPASSPAPHPSAQPAPSPHTPLPRTGAEFAQRVLAGRNSSPSEIATPSASEIPNLSGPGRDTGSEDSSSSSGPSPSATSPTRSSTNQTQPRPAPQSTSPKQSQPTLNQQHNSQPASTPPAPSSVPPGFGAPANWDVLIPPKPRRRFSRHWHLPE